MGESYENSNNSSVRLRAPTLAKVRHAYSRPLLEICRTSRSVVTVIVFAELRPLNVAGLAALSAVMCAAAGVV